MDIFKDKVHTNEFTMSCFRFGRGGKPPVIIPGRCLAFGKEIYPPDVLESRKENAEAPFYGIIRSVILKNVQNSL